MKKNIFLEILKILGAIIAGGFLWLIIFSFALPAAEDGSTSEPFPGAIIVLGVVTAVIVLLIINYNTMQKARQRTLSSFSNIKVFDERTDRLLTKANRWLTSICPTRKACRWVQRRNELDKAELFATLSSFRLNSSITPNSRRMRAL